MNKLLKAIVAAAVIAVYLMLLRYVAPSQEPYYILGTAVVGLAAWLCGSVMGLATALILIPMTSLVYEQFSVATSYASVASSPAYIAMQILAAISLGRLRHISKVRIQKDAELETANERLRNMLANVQELGGIHNLCSHCKSIQDKDGLWQHVDDYLKAQTKMEFSHCICPRCADKFHDKGIDVEPA